MLVMGYYNVQTSGYNVLGYLRISYDWTVIKEQNPTPAGYIYMYIYIYICACVCVCEIVKSTIYHLRHKAAKKYDNDGKDWYFRFHYEDNMSYTYTLSITQTLMGQFHTCSASEPICIMMIPRESSMHKAANELKAIMSKTHLTDWALSEEIKSS